MGLSIIAQGITTAYSVGMGCGTCCGSGMGVFISGYLATHSKNFRQSAAAFFVFYLGKIIAVAIMCAATALLGKSILSDSGIIFGININILVDIVMIAVGVYLLIKWIKKNRSGSCSGCNHCGNSASLMKNKKDKEINLPVMFSMGVCYGATPCAPLILILGYCVTLSVEYALIVGIVFSVASALSPTVVVILLTSGLAVKFREEIKGLAKWFQLACYLALIVITMINLTDTLFTAAA